MAAGALAATGCAASCSGQVLKQLADAQRELAEAIEAGEEEAAAAAEGGAAGGAADGQEAAAGQGQAGAASDDGSDFGLGTTETLSVAQLAVAQRSHALLAAVAGLVKAVVRQLLAER